MREGQNASWHSAMPGRVHRDLLAEVVVALATVESAGAHAACLESGGRSRTDRDRCGQASRRVPCLRERLAGPAERASPRGIPFLRLLLGSKGREVVEIVRASHGTPPGRTAT